LIAVVVGDEEVELNWTFGADGSISADDKETKAAVPILRFPMRLEIGDGIVDAPPETALLNDFLELGKTFKRHGNGEVDTKAV
jgi:hypothetical protein